MKRLCSACHAVSGCWDAYRLVHDDKVWVGQCERCGMIDGLVACMGYDFRQKVL